MILSQVDMHIEDPYCTYTSHMMPYVHAYSFRSQAVSMDCATKLSKLEHNVQSVPRALRSHVLTATASYAT